MSHQVFLSLGTNLGDRLENLRNALQGLPREIILNAVSSVYETPPWGITDQPSFLNLATKISTVLPPLELLTELKNLEIALGRTPTIRYGPRLIDLDILFYDDLVMNQPELIIPHPRLHERAFILVPLADLAPALQHPQMGKTVCELLEGVDRTGIKFFTSLELSSWHWS